MSDLYDKLHRVFNAERRFRFPFNNVIQDIPKNGLYLIFEKGEKYKNLDRIVRVGTHTGNDQLRSRLRQHFIKENKNRSIFRKNIGRCLLNKMNHPYLTIWDLDSTSRLGKMQYCHLIDRGFEQDLEKQISQYIQDNLSFTVFQINTKEIRLFWESRIVATLAAHSNITPSEKWLGHSSPKTKIQKYGLWQVNELLNQPLNEQEYSQLLQLIKEGANY